MSFFFKDLANKQHEDPLEVMNMASGEAYSHGSLLLKSELSELHHGPAHLKGKYELVGSDDEDIDAEALVDGLSKKQQKKLLK